MINCQRIVFTLHLRILLLAPVCQGCGGVNLVCPWHRFQVLTGFEANRRGGKRIRTKPVVHWKTSCEGVSFHVVSLIKAQLLYQGVPEAVLDLASQGSAGVPCGGGGWSDAALLRSSCSIFQASESDSLLLTELNRCSEKGGDMKGCSCPTS